MKKHKRMSMAILCWQSYRSFVLLYAIASHRTANVCAFLLNYRSAVKPTRSPVCRDARRGKNPKRGRSGARNNNSSSKTKEESVNTIEYKSAPTQQQKTISTSSHPKPANTKRVAISIPLEKEHDSLQVYVYQVDDNRWWNLDENTNPFGGRCWPGSIAVAQFLASSLETMKHSNVLELGCGTGIPSIVAASCGANVVATDVSLVTLDLLRKGWAETASKMNRNQRQHKRNDDTVVGSSVVVPAKGILSAQAFDLFSSDPLPIHAYNSDNNMTSQPTPSRPIVIAASMMYQADLAVALARRLAEAVRDFDAYVIVGDCDSGQRDSGRDVFVAELDKQLLPIDTTTTRRVWKRVTVTNANLKWQAKQVKLLLLNPPFDHQTVRRLGDLLLQLQ